MLAGIMARISKDRISGLSWSTRATPGNFLQPFDRLFLRYCSGGSCSDLVGLLVTHSLSHPKTFRR
jgi:hypothetical protein